MYNQHGMFHVAKICSTKHRHGVDLIGLKYLDRQIFINLHRFAENEYVLHQVGELPHVPNLFKQGWRRSWFGQLHLISPTLSGAHLNEALSPLVNSRSGCWAAKLPAT